MVSTRRAPTICALSLVTILAFHGASFAWSDASHEAKNLYIVYLGERQHEDADHATASHHSILSSVLGSDEQAAAESIVYSYKHGFSGFSAMLTGPEAETIRGLPGVVSARMNQMHSTHTTRSWDFMGLPYGLQPNGVLANAGMGEGIIIGVIDSDQGGD